MIKVSTTLLQQALESYLLPDRVRRLEDELEKVAVAGALHERSRWLSALEHTCGDNSCLFIHREGMGTNGGCRCIGGKNDPFEVRQAVTKAVSAFRQRAEQNLPAKDK